MEDVMSKEELARALSVGLNEVEIMVKQGLPSIDFAGKRWFLKSSVLKFFRDLEPKPYPGLKVVKEELVKVKLAAPSRG